MDGLRTFMHKLLQIHLLEIAFMEEMTQPTREADRIAKPWLDKAAETLDAPYLPAELVPAALAHANHRGRRPWHTMARFALGRLPFFLNETHEIGEADEIIAQCLIARLADCDVEVRTVPDFKTQTSDGKLAVAHGAVHRLVPESALLGGMLENRQNRHRADSA